MYGELEGSPFALENYEQEQKVRGGQEIGVEKVVTHENATIFACVRQRQLAIVLMRGCTSPFLLTKSSIVEFFVDDNLRGKTRNVNRWRQQKNVCLYVICLISAFWAIIQFPVGPVELPTNHFFVCCDVREAVRPSSGHMCD